MIMENKLTKGTQDIWHLNKWKIFLSLLFMMLAACEKSEPDPMLDEADNTAKFNANANFTVENLVSDVDEYGAAIIDPNLVNAWGIAFGPTGGIWVSATENGVSTIYDKNGNTLRPPVTVPFGAETGEPTGQFFNPTSAFVIPSTGQVSKFVFVTENGTVAAWASGNMAVTVADRSAEDAVYKGVALVNNGGQWVIYATDFHNGKVDMFNENFEFIGNGQFNDPAIPAGYAPFNIRQIGNRLFVTYAKQLAPDNEDDEAGAGNGYVDIYDKGGILIRRFVSGGALNSPWGIELAKPNNSVTTTPNQPERRQVILIGNFGDGHINAYDNNGMLIGALQSDGEPIEIEGLWAISYPPQANTAYRAVRNRIYFTAGPDDEEHGLFGYIKKDD
jgi:uncharacterized protein (TIGR03118 family)